MTLRMFLVSLSMLLAVSFMAGTGRAATTGSTTSSTTSSSTGTGAADGTLSILDGEDKLHALARELQHANKEQELQDLIKAQQEQLTQQQANQKVGEDNIIYRYDPKRNLLDRVPMPQRIFHNVDDIDIP